MTASEAGGGIKHAPRTPNSVLRGIREDERHESRNEFAEAMARLAGEMGLEVYPDGKYVQRLESGSITWPHRVHREILEQLCGRPARELGFAPASRLPNYSAKRSSRMNRKLREAIWESGTELSEFARTVGVDPKTAERWIVRGVIPRPLHRWKVSLTLGIDEYEFWPNLGTRQKVPTGGQEIHRVQIPAPRESARPNVAEGQSPAIAELSAMLTDYGFGMGRFSSEQMGDIPSLGDLERDVRMTFNAYQQSRFTSAASRVSALLADAQLAVRDCKEVDRPRVQRILALSYQAAASLLTKSGETDLAWIAAERGLNAAVASGTASVRGSLIRSVAFMLHSTGRFEHAMRLVDSSADSLYDGTAGNETMLSVYGTLLLVGSMAAARFGDSARTAEYLREASSAAHRLGKDGNYLWTSFGPTNVTIHRVNTAVELGNFQAVLDADISIGAAIPAERRVRYLLDVARVHALTGNQDDALGTMLTAERIAPEQVHQHYLSRTVVMTLIRNSQGKPAIELSKLATRVSAGESS